MRCEKNKWKRRGFLATIISMTLLLSSCGLLPQEEEYRAAPVLREYVAEEYSIATVGREDVQLTRKISCVYSSAQESQMGFGVSGLPVENLYVALGDMVRKGDVLAELDMGTLPEEQKQYRRQLESMELEERHLAELLNLERQRMEEAGETESFQEESYERQLLELWQDKELLNERLAAIQEKIDARRIVAPADGSVSYVKSELLGRVSAQEEKVIRLVSGEECYFVADKEETDFLKEGDIVHITVGSTVYEGTLQIPEGEEAATSVYFVIDTAGGQPEVGSKGSALLVLEERKNVLCLVNKAIKKIGEDSVVYYEDENGIKAMKYIETGLVGTQKTEILSGLEFGESVIVK